MSPRSRIVGPGRPPVSRAAIPVVDSWPVTSSGSPSSASSTWSRVIGRSLPISGQLCSVRRSSTVGGKSSSASSRRSATAISEVDVIGSW